MVFGVIETVLEGFKSLTTPIIQPVFARALYFMVQMIMTFLTIYSSSDEVESEKTLPPATDPQSFDFIIVGSGSSGTILANRLSKDYNVLLLEAGGEPNPLQFIPALCLFLINFPQTDWQLRSVPQKLAALLSANSEVPISSGKGLGGTGNLNSMIHLRGHWKDFENWARITGDPSWGWVGVLPYFKLHENFEIHGDPVNHGYEGELRIEAPDYIGNALEYINAGREIGYPFMDLNRPFNEGFDIVRYPILRGVRQGPYKAFLEPIRQRPTLTIMKFAHVNRVLFRNGNIAYGVEYDRHGKKYLAHAKLEVIISAGAIGSPKLLMLSGIGPKAHLQSLNIPVLADLPVGKNLHDHLAAYIGPIFLKEGLGNYLYRDITPSEVVKWLSVGTGRLSSARCEATAMISSSYAKARGEEDWPDLQLLFYSLTNFKLGPEILSRAFNLRYDDLSKYLEDSEGKDAMYGIVSVARPFSRGYVKLGGSSSYDKPIIDPQYLGDSGATDFKVLLEGTKKFLFLMENTTAGSIKLGAKFTKNRLPGCDHLVFRSDPYLECFIRKFTLTLHNFAGTCAMGSVVDRKLRVIGTKNLRVVDGSIQPTIVSTGTQASTFMIAEKAATIILNSWNNYRAFPKQKKTLKKPPAWDQLELVVNKTSNFIFIPFKKIPDGPLPTFEGHEYLWEQQKNKVLESAIQRTFKNGTTNRKIPKKQKKVSSGLIVPSEKTPPPLKRYTSKGKKKKCKCPPVNEKIRIE